MHTYRGLYTYIYERYERLRRDMRDKATVEVINVCMSMPCCLFEYIQLFRKRHMPHHKEKPSLS